MKHPDSDFEEFFQAERARDHRAAPSFLEMTASLPEPGAPARQWGWLPLAAAALAITVGGSAWLMRGSLAEPHPKIEPEIASVP